MQTWIKKFREQEKGQVATIFALSSLVIIGVAGMSVDYTLAGRRESQINGVADAAALSAVTPTSMALTPATAQTNAIAMFNTQISNLYGVNYNSDVDLEVCDRSTGTTTTCAPTNSTCGSSSTATSLVTRSVCVTWAGTSNNAFASLLKLPTTKIGGTSKSSNSVAPNVDFYLLLDTSPSMGIPPTTAGINLMVQNTSQQGGCAFACHETNPTSGDVAGNPNGEDNYTLARNLGINNLRIDMVQKAVANLYSTAQSTEATNHATYRVATYTFDQSFTTVTNLTSNLSQAASDATSKIKMLTVYSNGYLTSGNYNNDQDTQWDQAMANSAYLPTPGNGTNQSGDSPQEVLFIVTDGVVDEAYPNVGPTDMTYSGRTITMPPYQYDWCSPIKKKNIRIAILYLTYNPLPTNSFYNSYVDPFQAKIPNSLTACASSGLFFQVNTDGDINAAMQALFSKAVSSPHLTY